MNFNFFSAKSIFKLSHIIALALFLTLTVATVLIVYAQHEETEQSVSSEIAVETEAEENDLAINLAAVQGRLSENTKLNAMAVFSNNSMIIKQTDLYSGENEDEINITSFIKNSEHVEEKKQTVDSASHSFVSNQSGVIYTSPDVPVSYSKVLNMRATAYTYCYNEMDIAANGQPVQVGLVAADFSVIPMNTRVYIAAADGSWVYGYAIVGDTGVKGDVIDLFMTTTEQCFDFGVQNAVVYILD